MGWANDTINRGLTGAELSTEPTRYALKDNDGIVFFDEATTEWLKTAIDRIKTDGFGVPVDRRGAAMEKLHRELAKRQSFCVRFLGRPQ